MDKQTSFQRLNNTKRGEKIYRGAEYVGKSNQTNFSLDLFWVDEVAVKHEESACFFFFFLLGIAGQSCISCMKLLSCTDVPLFFS